MDKKMEIIIQFLSFLLVMVVAIGGIYIMLSYLTYSGNIELCERYEGYGYLTKVEGSIWDNNCYIFMEDGTKIEIRDFNIADYKIPLPNGG